MLTADQIIERLGGSAAIARETSFPLTTIEGWKEVNFIPAWRRDTLLMLAARTSVELSTTDFPTVDQRKPRSKADPSQAAA